MYYVYQITNKLNNMIYVGVHKTDDPDDSYMGSGIHIKRAIAKYGVKNFQKDILFEYENENEAYAKEAEIVNEDFLKRSDTYNITLGGVGGFYHIDLSGDKNPMKDPSVAAKVAEGIKQKRNSNKEFYDNVSKSNIEKYNSNKTIDKSHSDETKAKIAKGLKEYYSKNPQKHAGKPLSQETKDKISSAWSDEKKELQRQRMLARIAENPDCVKGMKGKKMSDDSKEKMKEAAKKRWEERRKVIATCPHCGKSGVEQSLKRWHFNNCRYKEKDIS